MRQTDQSGQSTVEFALVVPLLAIALLATIQVGLIVHAQIQVTHLAREIARAVAVDPYAPIDRLTQERSGLGYPEVEVLVEIEPFSSTTHRVVSVTVRYETPSIFNAFPLSTDGFEVASTAHMILES